MKKSFIAICLALVVIVFVSILFWVNNSKEPVQESQLLLSEGTLNFIDICIKYEDVNLTNINNITDDETLKDNIKDCLLLKNEQATFAQKDLDRYKLVEGARMVQECYQSSPVYNEVSEQGSCVNIPEENTCEEIFFLSEIVWGTWPDKHTMKLIKCQEEYFYIDDSLIITQSFTKHSVYRVNLEQGMIDKLKV